MTDCWAEGETTEKAPGRKGGGTRTAAADRDGDRYRMTDRPTNRQTDRQINRQTDKQTDRQTLTDAETDTLADTDTGTDRLPPVFFSESQEDSSSRWRRASVGSRDQHRDQHRNSTGHGRA